VNCASFTRWLDAGRPQGDAAAAHAHAASCARCTDALQATRELERMLARPAAIAPAGFADRVMARITAPEKAGSVMRRRIVWAPPGLPWWISAAAHPGTLLAFAVAALSLWARGAIWSFTTAIAAASWSPRLPSPEILQHPEIAVGIGLAFLPLAMLFARALFHAAEHWMGTGALTGRPRLH